MPVLRQHHERDYTVIPNPTIRDQRLSCRDLGLLVRMLQKPEEWKFTVKALAAELTSDGERTIQTGLKRLQELGYLDISREPRRKGKMQRSIWTVYDVPQLQNADMVTPDVGGQHTDKLPQLQNAVMDNCPENIATASPQLRYPDVKTAVGNKRNNNKKANAVSAQNGGQQRMDSYYLDSETGEWLRKEIV